VARGDARHLIPFFSRKWSSDLIFVRAHVQKDFAELLRDHKTAARTARWSLSVARAAVDAPTEDLLTQRVMAHERAAWMLRSMLVKSAPSLTKERLG